MYVQRRATAQLASVKPKEDAAKPSSGSGSSDDGSSSSGSDDESAESDDNKDRKVRDMHRC